MRIIRHDKVELKIPEKIIDLLALYIQDDDKKPESGGIIIGYCLGNNKYSVSDITFPSPEDKVSRYRFLRSKKKAQKIINQVFEESKGKKVYLGEWHTHPEDNPTPSYIDECSIKKQFRKNILNSDRIFMLIIGRKKFHLSSVDNIELNSFGEFCMF